MGSTFGALHLRGAKLDQVVDWVAQELEADELSRLDDADPETDAERRVLVFEDRGWVVVADEDLLTDEQLADTLGRHASSALAVDAIAISVFHSDTAIVARFRGGDRAGRFQVPEDGTLDPTTGHRRVASRFLADLAISSEARQALDAGLPADHTFPEETARDAAALIGLPHPGAGARYLWLDPPANAVRMRYAQRSAVAEPGSVEWRPPGSEGHAIFVSCHPEVTACVAMPLYEHVTIHVQAITGPRLEGLGVELRGPALALLDLPELAGWNPDTRVGETEVWIAPLEQRSGAWFASFPRAALAPSPQPMLTGTNAAALRAWKSALEAQSKNQFYFHLRGHARAAGKGELVIRMTETDGRALDANAPRITFDITPGPRMPVLPTAPADDTPHSQRLVLTAARCYAGDAWLSGWLGFDGPWSDLGALVLDTASQLASQLARRIGPLEITITAAGTHPEVSKPLGPRDALARHKLVARHLANEAAVELRAPYDRGDAGVVCLRHQPEGTTIFDRDMRAALAAQSPQERIVPIDLQFSLHRPQTPAELAELGALIDRLFARAAAHASCVGGFVAPTGDALRNDGTPYEELAQQRDHDTIATVRRRPRAPGWRVIVPPAAVHAIALQPGVTRSDVACGVLLASTATEPFAMTSADREAIERTIVAAFR